VIGKPISSKQLRIMNAWAYLGLVGSIRTTVI
jgi:hypothetical protein